MILRKWEELPENIKIEEVKAYYDILKKKQLSLIVKRIFDVVMSIVLLIILAIPMFVLALWIKLDSDGPAFYRQERVTTYGKHFKIHKFRTMVINADKMGSLVTVGSDNRITRVGAKIRRLRLDELPQLIDVLEGNMSFVGTRPEAVKYVDKYLAEYKATLLLPAGITSEASIRYKDEDKLLNSAEDIDKVYLEKVLPEKMKWNLKSIKEFDLITDISIMIRTVLAVLGKEYE